MTKQYIFPNAVEHKSNNMNTSGIARNVVKSIEYSMQCLEIKVKNNI